ncbi:MAG: hypothetical protein K2J50_06975, partial [Treponemataceae bacterium]|nr:hypothetical protein [Treponemataceae bacterium]
KSSVQGSLCFEEFFVLLDERPSAYYAFQRNVMLKIMTFAEKNGIGITGFERTNFIFNSGPLPYFISGRKFTLTLTDAQMRKP